jgi:hypothetical protein
LVIDLARMDFVGRLPGSPLVHRLSTVVDACAQRFYLNMISANSAREQRKRRYGLCEGIWSRLMTRCEGLLVIALHRFAVHKQSVVVFPTSSATIPAPIARCGRREWVRIRPHAHRRRRNRPETLRQQERHIRIRSGDIPRYFLLAHCRRTQKRTIRGMSPILISAGSGE